MPLSRRDFLAALAATAVLPSVVRIDAGAQTDAASRFFSDEASAKKIGVLYLAQVDPPEDEATLRVLVAPPDEDAEEWFGTVSRKDFEKWIRQKVRTDFETGDTAILSGWVLAATEARLCALVSLG